jgi:hypothetical protein
MCVSGCICLKQIVLAETKSAKMIIYQYLIWVYEFCNFAGQLLVSRNAKYISEDSEDSSR